MYYDVVNTAISEEILTHFNCVPRKSDKKKHPDCNTTNINGMWNLKNMIFPKHTKPLPVAKKNVDGRLVSSHSELKDLHLETNKKGRS